MAVKAKKKTKKKTTKIANDKKLVSKPYDVCLSFAGENRAYVGRVAKILDERGIRVFYDKYDEVNLWGKDLYSHLNYVYEEAAHYCVMFVSKYYAKKVWTNHERQSAQARAIKESGEYVLPARFDKTPIPGLRDTIGHIDLQKMPPAKLAALIEKKLKPLKLLEFQERDNYFPPVPDKLFKIFSAKHGPLRDAIYRLLYDFEKSLQRLTEQERLVVLLVYIFGCTHDVVEDVHIEFDLLRRISGISTAKIHSVLSGISSVGFQYKVERPQSGGGKSAEGSPYAHLSWHGSSIGPTLALNATKSSDNAVAWAAVSLVKQNYCEDHGIDTLMRLNFSALSTFTTTPDRH